MADSDIFVSNDVQLDVDFGTMYVIDQGIVIKVVAKKYDPTKTYVVGEYVIYQEKLYKCNTAIEEPEEFNAEKWNNVLLADEVQIANANIALKANARDVYAKSETYNKTEVNTALESKADTATTYTKTEVDTALGDKADKSDTYTKTEVDTALSAKANSDDVYAKTDTYSKDEIDTNIYTKSETYNKNEVDGIINNLPAPMIFKGTLGVNGTITDLPTASADNEGYTYKVITDGTYASTSAKVGDMFTSNGSAWVHIPSGDETFTDTWRSIKVNGAEKLSGSITSGSVDFKNGTNSTAVFDPSDNSIKVNVDGYTQSEIDTKLSAKANQADVTTALNNKADKSTTYTKTEVNTALALKADKSTTYTKTEVDNLVTLIGTASGAIATFETNMVDVLQSVKCNILATGGNGSPDNPISINGYSSANITRCGVNLFDKTATDTTKGYKDDYYLVGSDGSEQYNANYSISEYIPFKSGISFCLSNVSGYNPGIAYYDTNKTLISSATYSGNTNFTATTPSGTAYIRFSIVKANINITQLELGSTATSYAPYNGQTYTIAFGQTVYGGVLDVTRGKLHVTWAGVDLGSQNWNIYGGDKFYTTISDLKLPTTTAERATGMLCSIFAPSSGLSVGEMDNNSFLRFNQSENFWVRDTAYSDATAFKTAMEGVILAYELATPFDIDLTPEVISAVVGMNNVYTDTNGDTTVQYKDTIQHYIDKHIGG